MFTHHNDLQILIDCVQQLSDFSFSFGSLFVYRLIFCFNFQGLAALNGTVISGDVYAWVIVFVLPVNSALNPILYTISSLNIVKVCGDIIVAISNKVLTKTTITNSYI